jgi:hypothetical protein
MRTTEKTEAHRALVLPWDEAASRQHAEHPGRVYQRGEVHMPRRDVMVRLNHGGPQIGVASSFAVTNEGMEAEIKLGRRGPELLERGHVGLSPEIDEDTGDLIGVALAVDGEPAFRSARIIVENGVRAEAPVRLVMDPSSGAVFLRPPTRALDPLPPTRVAMDLTAAREFAASYSMAAVEGDVARDRERFARRQEERVQEDLDREEGRLIASMTPVDRWPVHLPKRQQWETLRTQQAIETATANANQHYEELAREQAARRRRWWQIGRR